MISCIPDICLGIDLGTSNTCFSVFRNGAPEVLSDRSSNRITPTVISFFGEDFYLGNSAKDQLASNYKQTIYQTKRLIGRKKNAGLELYASKLFYDVKFDSEGLPYMEIERVVKDKRGNTSTQKINLDPVQAASLVLQDRFEYYKDNTQAGTNDCVITVPANFNDYQRRSTIEAGKIAGMNVIGIVNEPTAAAIYAAIDNKNEFKGKHNILVFDFGGGTLDVTILEINEGKLTVLSTDGDVSLGGTDIDLAIAEYLETQIKHIIKRDLVDREKANVIKEAEKCKCELSAEVLSSTANITIEGKNIPIKFNRAQMAQCCKGIEERVMEPVKGCITNANITADQIHRVILTGGSSRVHFIIDKIRDFFGADKVITFPSPDEAISKGAAIYGAILKKQKIAGIETINIVDVTPMAIGIGSSGGIVKEMIPRNSQKPYTSREVSFISDKDYEKSYIDVYEGDSQYQADCHRVGHFTIQRPPDGRIRITVVADIDCIRINVKDRKGNKADFYVEQESHTDREIEKFHKLNHDILHVDNSTHSDKAILFLNRELKIAANSKIGKKYPKSEQSKMKAKVSKITKDSVRRIYNLTDEEINNPDQLLPIIEAAIDSIGMLGFEFDIPRKSIPL